MVSNNSNLNSKQFIAVDSQSPPKGGEDAPPYRPHAATAQSKVQHKCNISLGHEALDSAHRKVCSDH
jgi:hypothetical protein